LKNERCMNKRENMMIIGIWKSLTYHFKLF
jgi:hypothetical protein